MDNEITTSTQLKIGEKETESLYYMQQLLNDDTAALSVDGDEQLNRVKLAYIEFAKNNLNQVITLTRFLEKIENKFILAVDDVLENEPNSIMLMTTVMDTLTRLITSCQATVRDVLKDDRLQNIVIKQTNIITQDGSKATIIDPASRDEIRNLAASLISQLSAVDTSDDIIDIDQGDVADV